MKTLGLNIIIGSGDEDLLLRLLLPIVHAFDQIVIGNTTKDEKTSEVLNDLVKKFESVKIIDIEWSTPEHPHGNFGRARQLVLDATETDYVMWLDCDDFISHKDFDSKISQLMENLNKSTIDFVNIEYRLDYEGESCLRSLYRPRIFRRCPEIKWIYPIHEQLQFNSKALQRDRIDANVKNLWVEHRNMKPHIASVARNLNILETCDMSDWRMKYFYALELLSASKVNKCQNSREKAIEMLEDLTVEQAGTKEFSASVCLKIAYDYLYGDTGDVLSVPINTPPENINKAEDYCRLALSLDETFAEIYIMMGDIETLKRKNPQDGVPWYKKALQCRVAGGVELRLVWFYEFIPSRRLAFALSMNETDQELALWYTFLVLKYDKHDTETRDLRRKIIGKINESDQKYIGENKHEM